MARYSHVAICVLHGMSGSTSVAIAACLNAGNKDHVSTNRLNTITTLKKMVEKKEKEEGNHGLQFNARAFTSDLATDLMQYGLVLKKVYGYDFHVLLLYVYIAKGLRRLFIISLLLLPRALGFGGRHSRDPRLHLLNGFVYPVEVILDLGGPHARHCHLDRIGPP